MVSSPRRSASTPIGHGPLRYFSCSSSNQSCLSSDSQAVTRRCFHTLAVHVDDAAVDACFEVFGIDEGPVGEVMTLQIAPGEFDVVEFGRVFRQPLDREPGTGCERLAG